MKYLAYDGKVFDNECECMEYEHQLNEKEKEKALAMSRLKELEEKFKKAEKLYKEGLQEYYDKYESIPSLIIDGGVALSIIRSVFPWM
jgi:hypothetical protein